MEEEYNPGTEKTNSSRWWKIGGGAAVVAVGLVIGVVVASGGGGSAPQVPNTPSTGNPSNPGSSKNKSPTRLALEPYALVKTAFDDPNSYQSKALAWLEQVHENEGKINEERLLQRFALACVYHSTYAVRTEYTDFMYGAENDVLPWIRSRQWLESNDECEWFGVICQDTKVLVLNLANNRLSGSFPSEAQYLDLRVLDLQNNLLYNNNEEGNDWMGKMTNLEQLYLGKTSFRYNGLPQFLRKLTKLEELDVSYTLYFGPLDGTIFENLIHLNYLYIGGNSFDSPIPSQIANLPNLTYFYAENSDITGTLDFLTSMKKIRELWIDDNPRMSGGIPAGMGQMLSLESFSVTNCNLSGRLPDINIPRMKQMWFYNNSLTGPIPPSLGSLVSLERAYFQGNKFTGKMPDEACNARFAGEIQTLEADCDVCARSSLPDCCTCCSMTCISDELEGNAN